MHPFNRLFALWSLMLFALGALHGAPLSVDVDQHAFAQGEGVTVTITAEGKGIVFPTLTSIGSYPIDARNISNKTEARYSNGVLKTLSQKTMRFRFFPENNVTIPAFAVTINGTIHRSKPIQIHRRAASQKPSASHGGFRLTMLTERHEAYVGEPFLLQVIFFEPRSSEIARAKYVAPKFDGFYVKSSPQERLEDTPEGTEHVFDYILTPQRQGTMTITAPQIDLEIRAFSGTRDPWGFFNNDIRRKSLRGTAKTITIKPLPAPADLVGTFTLQATATPRSIAPNKPVNYTLSLTGKGSLDEMDDPTFDLPGVTIYSDEAVVNTQVQDGHIVTNWVKKYTFIGDRDFTIPALKLTAFDPKTAKTSTLKTSPFSVHIQGSASKPTTTHTPSPAAPRSSSAQSAPPMTTKPAPTESNVSLFEDEAFYARKAQEKRASLYSIGWLIGAFFVGILALLIGQYAWRKLPQGSRKKMQKKYTTDEALAILYPHTNDTPEIEKMVRDLYQIKNGKSVPIDPKRLAHLLRHVQKQ